MSPYPNIHVSYVVNTKSLEICSYTNKILDGGHFYKKLQDNEEYVLQHF